MRAPWAFVRLAQHWGLSCPQVKHLWRALAQARWTAAATWREALWNCEGRPGVPVAVLLAHWPPPVVLAAVEALREEHRVSRATAMRVNACILSQVDRTGDWVGFPTPDVGRALDLAAVIERYWS